MGNIKFTEQSRYGNRCNFDWTLFMDADKICSIGNFIILVAWWWYQLLSGSYPTATYPESYVGQGENFHLALIILHIIDFVILEVLRCEPVLQDNTFPWACSGINSGYQMRLINHSFNLIFLILYINSKEFLILK